MSSFTLQVRHLHEGDVGRQTPHLPDDDQFEMGLEALREDLLHVEVIARVERIGSAFRIVTSEPVSEAELQACIKHVFTGDLASKLRFKALHAE